MPLFHLSDVVVSSSAASEEITAKPMTAHHELIVTVVTQQLGPLAGAVCRALTLSGPLTLAEISNAVKEDEEVRGVVAAAANRASASGERTTAVPATHQIGADLRIDFAAVSSANELIHEVAVKEVVTRLVIHRLIHADSRKHVYALRPGFAIFLRVLFPLVVQHVRRQRGEAAKCALLVVYQLGVVALRAAVQVAVSRMPDISRDAMERAVEGLVEDGWLEPVPDVPSAVSQLSAGQPSTPLPPADGRSDLWNSVAPYRIGIETALHFLLIDAIEQAVAERFTDGGVAAALVRALCRREAPRSRRSDAAVAWQDLAAELQPTAGVRRDRSGEAHRNADDDTVGNAEVVQRCLECLSQPMVLLSLHASDSTALPAAHAAGPSSTPPARSLLVQVHNSSGFYALDRLAAVRLLQEAVCERVICSRFGVLGVRIMKLLLQHHYLEERVLAEQSVATYVKTRELLHHMFREGVLLQQEVPRSSAVVERAAKTSVFLWGVSWSATLLPTVRERLAKTLTVTMVKLKEAQEHAASLSRLHSSCCPSPEMGSTHAEEAEVEIHFKYGMSRSVQEALHAQHTVTGLQSSAMALMRLLCIVDFF